MNHRIYKHFSANSLVLEPFDFIREVSMESYLIENPSILELDTTNYTDVEIIKEELYLADGRSSRETDGRIDLLVCYAQECLGVVELKNGQLNHSHLAQLEDYLKARNSIFSNYQYLFSENDTNYKWIGLLVGTSIEPALAELLAGGYACGDSDVRIAALTLSRFRNPRSGEIYVLTENYFKNSGEKDTSQYEFNGVTYGKGRLVHAVISEFVRLNRDIAFNELLGYFPKELQGYRGVFSAYDEARLIFEQTGRKRHFIGEHEIIKLEDSKIAVSNQWNLKNIDRFIENARSLGLRIERE